MPEARKLQNVVNTLAQKHAFIRRREVGASLICRQNAQKGIAINRTSAMQSTENNFSQPKKASLTKGTC